MTLCHVPFSVWSGCSTISWVQSVTQRPQPTRLAQRVLPYPCRDGPGSHTVSQDENPSASRSERLCLSPAVPPPCGVRASRGVRRFPWAGATAGWLANEVFAGAPTALIDLPIDRRPHAFATCQGTGKREGVHNEHGR